MSFRTFPVTAPSTIPNAFRLMDAVWEYKIVEFLLYTAAVTGSSASRVSSWG